MKKVLGYYIHRYQSGIVRMIRGKREWQEPREFYRIWKGRHPKIVLSGSINSTLFLSRIYGKGDGAKASDEQIVDAVTHDESIF